MTASTRAGRPPSYSTVTWLFPSGPQVVEDLVLAHLAQALRQLVREHDGQRHQLFRLVAGVAEHQALVARAPRVHAHGDVGRLLVDGGDHAAGLVVEAVLGAGVADALDGVAHDRGQVRVGLGRDLAGDEGEAGGDHRLAGHPAVGVLGQDRVQDGVRDLVGDLVGVAFGHRLRSEEMPAVLSHPVSSGRRCSKVRPGEAIPRKARRVSPASAEGQSIMTDARYAGRIGDGSGPRMELVVHLAQPLARDVGVDLGGRDVGVAQHGLQRPQVRAPLEQMGGEGVAEHVRRQRRAARPPSPRGAARCPTAPCG